MADNGTLLYVGAEYVCLPGTLATAIDYYPLGEIPFVVEVTTNFNPCDRNPLLKLSVGAGAVPHSTSVSCIPPCD